MENMPNWKAKRSNNFEHKKRVSHLIEILEIIMQVMFLIKTFKGIKLTPNKTLLAPEIKNLRIITVITLRIMNVKNR